MPASDQQRRLGLIAGYAASPDPATGSCFPSSTPASRAGARTHRAVGDQAGATSSESFWGAKNSGFRGKVGANHRMLSTHLNQLNAASLGLEITAEPSPAGPWLRGKRSEDLVPVFLVARFRRSLISAVHLAHRGGDGWRK
jgi:hypothetical protein